MKNIDSVNTRAGLDEFFNRERQNFLDDIAGLVAIDSSRCKGEKGMPFGAGAAHALKKGVEIAERLGFRTKNYDNYVITADMQEGEPMLGILAHLDVVPAGEGWTYPPFKLTVDGDRIYGRGTTDDKGPAVAALYAMAAAKAVCPELSQNCRVILGAAEETGSEDLDHYSRIEPYPPMVFTPDANYPVINFEKGRFAPIFGANWPKDTAARRIISFDGGVTPNVVPHKAECVITGFTMDEVTEACREYSLITGVRFSAEERGNTVRISAEGTASHAAQPEDGNNAQTALIALLASMPFDKGGAYEAIKSLNVIFPHGETDGKSMGIKMSGKIADSLTVNFGVLHMTEEGFKANFDSRIPDGGNASNICSVVEERLKLCGMSFMPGVSMTMPHYTPEDSELVKALLRIYGDYTGTQGKCLAIGGGTYAHDIDGAVAFGCEMPGTDYRIHGADEFAVTDELILSAKMFAQAIIDICS